MLIPVLMAKRFADDRDLDADDARKTMLVAALAGRNQPPIVPVLVARTMARNLEPEAQPNDDTNGDETNGDETNGDDTDGDDTNGDDDLGREALTTAAVDTGRAHRTTEQTAAIEDFFGIEALGAQLQELLHTTEGLLADLLEALASRRSDAGTRSRLAEIAEQAVGEAQTLVDMFDDDAETSDDGPDQHWQALAAFQARVVEDLTEARAALEPERS